MGVFMATMSTGNKKARMVARLGLLEVLEG